MVLPRVTPVDRIARPDPAEFFERYIMRRRPVILTDVAASWPAHTKWTPEYFKERFGGVEVECQVFDPTQVDVENPLEALRCRKYERISMAVFVETAFQDTAIKRYLAQWPVFKKIPQLKEDVGSLAEYCISSRRKNQLPTVADIFLWFGPAGTYSPTHFDTKDNLFVQLWGTKTFTLFSPEESRNLYYPWHEYGMFNFSPLDISKPDLERFPRFQRATRYTCQVAPGEILYLPARWWHCVSATEHSISLSHWWTSHSSLTHRAKDLVNELYYLARTRVFKQTSWRRRDQKVARKLT
jgi:lysine-specific demethylase 8